MINQDTVKKLFKYDDGGLIRRIDVAANALSGDVVGCDNGHGYLVFSIEGDLYQVHRVVWLYFHGEFPNNDIDHIDHDRKNNRIENLRCVTRQENMLNSRKRKDNTSGFVGVYRNRQEKNWYAQITFKGKTESLGSFDFVHDAVIARKKAEARLGFHANHGK